MSLVNDFGVTTRASKMRGIKFDNCPCRSCRRWRKLGRKKKKESRGYDPDFPRR